MVVIVVMVCFLIFGGDGGCYYVNSVVSALYLCAPFNVCFK